MHSFSLKSHTKEELIDITNDVQRIVEDSNIMNGVCYIFTPHTTAGITINENADPTVKKDIIKGILSLNLESVKFSHMEGNSPAHIKSSLIGCSEIIFVENKKIQMGTWQGIFFCEFDGPRSRKVTVRIL